MSHTTPTALRMLRTFLPRPASKSRVAAAARRAASPLGVAVLLRGFASGLSRCCTAGRPQPLCAERPCCRSGKIRRVSSPLWGPLAVLRSSGRPWQRAAQPTFALPLTTVAATPCAAGGAQFTVSRIGTDDELTITDQAAKQLKYLAEKEGAPDQALRITVESGGCHGFQYRLELTTKLEKDDVLFEKHASRVVVDTVSLPFIEGSTLDYIQELIGSAFRITKNPKAVTGCGCGTSFGV